MSKYLVLGSEGQIGKSLVRMIREKGHEAIEFDIVRSTTEDLRVYENPLLEKAVVESDFIFFLAFDVGGSRYLKIYQDTYDFISNNLKIIDRVFDKIQKYHKPFIFASSQMANMSYSSYGLVKSVAEKVTNILDGLVVKFWNVYGLEHDLEKSHVITDLIIKASTKKEIALLTDGKEERQFLYADDCCEALLILIDNYGDIDRTKPLHITNFEWHSILDVAKIISSHFPGSKIMPSESKDEVQKNKKNEPDRYILKYWRPKTSLEEGIEKIINQMEVNGTNQKMNKDRVVKISTITPAYKIKRYLKRFLDELPKQTVFNRLEVVLDHNEPDDEEIEWVKDFQKKYPGRLKHIIAPKVDPIGTSMNRCINESTGEFLCIWNVDDLRTPDSIEQQAKVLEENPDIGIVYGDFRIVRSFGATEGKLINNALVESELSRSMVIGPFYMFRKNIISKSGLFDEQLKSGADFDLAIRLAFHAKVARALSLLGYYLNEGKGASTRPGSLQAVERTVIELRYGIYDKIDYDYIPETAKYDTLHIHVGSQRTKISEFVPDYEKMINERRERWYTSGITKHHLKKAVGYKPARRLAAKVVRKFRSFLKP